MPRPNLKTNTHRRDGAMERLVIASCRTTTRFGVAAAIFVCPGGGFRFLYTENEGSAVALWFNSIGITAFVLKYRVMRTGAADAGDAAKMSERRKEVIPLAIADGQQALRLVRSRAA